MPIESGCQTSPRTGGTEARIIIVGGRDVAKVESQLINHRDVARMFGVTTSVITRAIERGEFPTPHSQIGSFFLFDRAMVEHRLKHGTWPATAKFRGVRGEVGE
jgi:predicted DNA-binding transcriptional regulator AlpA